MENEYGNVEWAYGVGGELYVQWAAAAALDLNTSVPWVMCQQEDAPDPIVCINWNLIPPLLYVSDASIVQS